MKHFLLISLSWIALNLQAQKLEWMQTNYYSQNCRNSSNLALDPSGNVIVAGISSDDNAWLGGRSFIEKYNPSGNLLWADTTGYFFATYGSAGVTTDVTGNMYTAFNVQGDTGIVIQGQWYPGFNSYLIKYNSLMQFTWVRSLGYMIVSSLACDAQNRIYVSGAYGTQVWSSGGNLVNQFSKGAASIFVDQNMNLVTPYKKLSAAGSELCSFISNDYASVSGDASGNNYIFSSDIVGNSTLEKIGPNCASIWSVPLNQRIGAVHVSGNFIFTAGFNSGLIVKKYNLNGQEIWSVLFPDPTQSPVYSFEPSGILTYSNAVYISGSLDMQQSKGFLLKLEDTAYSAGSAINGLDVSAKELHFELFPNPANQSFNVLLPVAGQQQSLTIFDLSGQELYKELFKELDSSYSYNIKVTQLPPGVYIVELRTGNVQARKKLVISVD